MALHLETVSHRASLPAPDPPGRGPARPVSPTCLARGLPAASTSSPPSPALARPPRLGPRHPAANLLFSARGLARTWPETGLHVVAACLQKAATGRTRNSARTTALEAPWRIAAPATTGTPSSAPDQPSISCTRVLHQRIRALPSTLDWGAPLHPRRRYLGPLLPARSGGPSRRASVGVCGDGTGTLLDGCSGGQLNRVGSRTFALIPEGQHRLDAAARWRLT